MDKADEHLSNINKTLERQNDIMQQMLDIMPRPSGKFTKVLEMIVLFIGVFGFVSIVDIIRRWITGG